MRRRRQTTSGEQQRQEAQCVRHQDVEEGRRCTAAPDELHGLEGVGGEGREAAAEARAQRQLQLGLGRQQGGDRGEEAAAQHVDGGGAPDAQARRRGGTGGRVAQHAAQATSDED
eukprot:CAMPEP_0175696548 /NCGR_PEP_ID=MMETSP0097-20121207/33007_1 /TAXON_ID=311494 /ORGANISM="Alexandrium monilatum, Strain CCMP3105" /LENGTH=114 /DNA_ID=CAMNT_0017003707 /DNA_START=293 /DNA_END=635 /DNA_ORIENTATION=+